MSRRTLLATLLAALLLWVPCAASACATMCGIARLGSGCHQAGLPASAAYAMVMTDHCDGEASGRALKAVTGDAALHAGICAQGICVAHPQNPEAVMTPAPSQPQLQPAALAVSAVAAPQIASRPSRAEASPLRLALFAYLQTPLRI